jgi:hypothetical protein
LLPLIIFAIRAGAVFSSRPASLPGGVSVSSTKALFIFVLLAACCASGARRVVAQQQQPITQTPASVANTVTQSSRTSTQSPVNDLEITANATARELRFDVVPQTKVEFTGSHERDTVWEAERQNLPRPVQPGVTYRNIGIQLKITSRFADIERIVAEALGEVPITDDKPAGSTAPQTSTPPAGTTSPSTPQGERP